MAHWSTVLVAPFATSALGASFRPAVGLALKKVLGL
jgi:hypothetical protein